MFELPYLLPVVALIKYNVSPGFGAIITSREIAKPENESIPQG